MFQRFVWFVFLDQNIQRMILRELSRNICIFYVKVFEEVFEKKILSNIFDPVRVGYDFHIRKEKEICDFLNDLEGVQHIKIQRLCWCKSNY